MKRSIALPAELPSINDPINDLKNDLTWNELAAQCWQEDTTKDRVFDDKLAAVFARKLEEQAGKERLRIVTLLLSNKDVMSVEYKHTIKHTGGLLTRSMVYAYSKAINDIFKLINTTRRNKE